MDVVQVVYNKVQLLPLSQIQQVLDFIDTLPSELKGKNTIVKPLNEVHSISLEVAQYAGMVKVKSTPQIESMISFDPASIATDSI